MKKKGDIEPRMYYEILTGQTFFLLSSHYKTCVTSKFEAKINFFNTNLIVYSLQ